MGIEPISSDPQSEVLPLYESHSDPSGETTPEKQPCGLFLVDSARALLAPDRVKRDLEPSISGLKAR